MATYLCRNCNYKFAPRTAKIPSRCPFCDKGESLIREKGAAELLKEDLSYFDDKE